MSVAVQIGHRLVIKGAPTLLSPPSPPSGPPVALGETDWSSQSALSINDSSSLGTVRYMGPLKGDPSKKLWVGIEWDSPTRGNHDGVVDGERYFECQQRWIARTTTAESSSRDTRKSRKYGEKQASADEGQQASSENGEAIDPTMDPAMDPAMERLRPQYPDAACALLTSGSFLLLDGLLESSQFGTDFASALRQRYCRTVTQEEEKGLTVGDEATGKTTPVEIVGLRKAEAFFSTLSNLECVDLDGYYVNSNGHSINERPPTSNSNRVTSSDEHHRSTLSDDRRILTTDGQSVLASSPPSSRVASSPLRPSSPLSVFSRVKFCSLRSHLIQDFHEVAKILLRLPNLEVFVLSNSNFPRYVDALPPVLSPRATSIQALPPSGFLSTEISPWNGLSEVSSSLFVHSKVSNLNIQATGIEWIDFPYLSKIFPNVQSVDISHSPQLFDLISNQSLVAIRKQQQQAESSSSFCFSSSSSPFFPTLSTLKVHHCDIRTWTSLFSLFEVFPSLSKVGGSFNHLADDTSITELYQYQGTSMAARVTDLGLDDNEIRKWESIRVLSTVFDNVVSLRWYGNPLQQTGVSSLIPTTVIPTTTTELTSCPTLEPPPQQPLQKSASTLTGQQLSRLVLIGVFPRLQNLNGCAVVPTERKHAERYFLILAARHSCIHSKVDPEGFHAQRLEQIHQTGWLHPPLSDKGTDEESGSLERPLSKPKHAIDVHFEFTDQSATDTGGPTRTMQLPLWLKVSDLKLICQRLFHLPPSQQRLSLCCKSMPVPVDLMEDDFSLDFYGVEPNCKIIVGIIGK